MRRTLFFVLILYLLVVVYFNRAETQRAAFEILYKSPCDTPISYSIGEIDSKFGISRAEFLKNTIEASKIWSEAANRPLFRYDPDSSFTVSLIYDVRQKLSSQIGNLNTELEQKSSQIEPRIKDYERRVAEFKAKIAVLNAEIDQWNEQGGAPPDVYKSLIERQKSLATEANDLNAEARSLNQSTQEYNLKVGQLNQEVGTFNKVLEHKPEEGIYTYDSKGERIIIYFYTSKQDLVHTLTHEMGHALGMVHVQDSEAIMFSQTNNATVPKVADLSELQRVCKKKNIITAKVQKFAERLRLLLASINSASR